MQGGKGDGKRKTWLLASRRWEFIKLGSVWDILLPHPDPLSALLCPALCLKSCPVWTTPVFSLVLWPRSMRRLEEGRRVRSEYLFPQPPPCSSTGGRWNSRSHLWVLDLATSSHPQPLSPRAGNKLCYSSQGTAFSLHPAIIFVYGPLIKLSSDCPIWVCHFLLGPWVTWGDNIWHRKTSWQQKKKYGNCQVSVQGSPPERGGVRMGPKDRKRHLWGKL